MAVIRPDERNRAPLYYCLAFLTPSVDVGGVAEACLRFTPDLAVRHGTGGRADPAIFLEVSRCLSLYSADALERRIRILLREWGIGDGEVRIARASSLPRSWVCAKEGIPESLLDEVPIASIPALLDPLGDSAVSDSRNESKKIRAMVESLFLLGIRRIGAIRKLPPDSAVTRFGEAYSRLIERIEPGRVAEDFPWERFRPGERFLERIDFDPDRTFSDLEPALFHSKSLLDRVLKRAFGRGKALVGLELRIECERRIEKLEVSARIPIRFTFPQTESAIILRTLREKLSNELGRRELDAPVAALELEVTELSPRRPIQSDFLDGDPEDEGFRELVTELGTKLDLGREVYQAELVESWRPERSWRRVLKDPALLESRSLPIVERPLTLLDPPEPLRRLGRYFFRDGERFSVESFSRIERLSGEWWESDGGFTRTYYRVRVRDPAGEPREFWIFRDQRSEEVGGLFLHGLY